jgi:hypothetical protein
MRRQKWVLMNLLVFSFLVSSCGMQAVELAQPSQTPFVITQLVTVIVEVTVTPEAKPTVTDQIILASPTVEVTEVTWVASDQAINYVGEFISVRLESAQCSFQASINGTPTFCNDLPFPNHNFTFLVWGQDWSAFNKTCVVVEGLVELYQGKPQIEVTSQGQVANCDD